MSVVIAAPVSDEIRSYASLYRIDYAEAFQLGVPRADARAAEVWLRAIFESLPAPARVGLRLGWRAISVRLGPYPSAEHVLGWALEDSQPRWARLATHGWLGVRANLVLRVEATVLTLVTFLEYRRPAARVMWLFVRPLHVVIARFLLSRMAELS
ncbi:MULTISPECIES: hypothetical protein [unclassified Saccharopolyspora]|uniref:hypothetical protein n=1 Tax=unclassified Saccharopolyspora TaxID=2646250 RepID=UPI001CD5E11D|nr:MULTISPECIES: hypothetical protein [unclassified Saccharopolyspora]MCA1186214.1 hypothetical protein [Saccharopolyspora sp. 6T]MCA1278416.1 hypothetical protein [Saccharopolyspora sp. 7B]